MAEKPTILIADDEEISRAILREILKSKYRILEAENGQQAVLYIQAEELNIDLLILDIHMPKLDGFGVMDYIVEKKLTSKLPVIVTTADESSEALVQAKNYKVVDIVYKPYRAPDIIKTVDTLVDICKLEKNLESIIAQKSVYLTNQYEVFKKSRFFRRPKWDDNVKELMKEISPERVPHMDRVKRYTEVLLLATMERYPQYGLNKSMCKTIAAASLLHGIGASVIPDSLFDKNDPSAHKALMQLRRRPIAGAELVNMIFANSPFQSERKYAYDICRYLHEQYDGKGYPMGAMGDEIPIGAQAVGLVHRYDELRFAKNGKNMPHKLAMRTILDKEFKAYSPNLLEVFEDLSDSFDEIASRVYNEEKD